MEYVGQMFNFFFTHTKKQIAHSHFDKSICLSLASILFLISTSGCTAFGTHYVNIDADAELRTRSAPESAWVAVAGENVKWRHVRSIVKLNSTTFRSSLFDWRLGMTALSLGHSIKSNVPGKLCFLFDEARISSNMHEGELPFEVTFAEHGAIQSPQTSPRNRLPPEMRPVFRPPPMCFSQGQETRVGFVLPLTKLYPSGKIFNLRWNGNSTLLLDKGIGNWLRLSLPIEHQGKREELEITVTLKDAEAGLHYL